MVNTFAQIGANPKIVSTILSNTSKVSGFQRLARQVELDHSGSIVTEMDSTQPAQWVAEGATKPVVDAVIAPTEMVGAKLAKVVVYTDELSSVDYFLNELSVGLPASLARGFDQTVAGAVGAPNGQFDTFATGVDTVTITNRQSFVRATSSHNGARTTGIVLNTALLDELNALSNAYDQAVLNVVVTDGISGTINGIPYAVADLGTSDPVGFAGAWDKAIWGVVPGTTNIRPVVGAYRDGSNVIQMLDQDNKKALRVETKVGFRVLSKDYFVKIEGTGSES